MTNSIMKQNQIGSLRSQTLAAVAATLSAVALPQLCHLFGSLSGLGTTLGETLLPMHLPILLIGLLSGPYAGALAGFCSPLLSFFVTGMPSATLLPFMMIELCVYGLSTGLLRNRNLPCVCKIVVAQIAGRVARSIAILVAVYGFGNDLVSVAIIWNSISAGIIGLVLQWTLLPLIVKCVESGNRNAS